MTIHRTALVGLVLLLGVGGCLTGDTVTERSWGQALAMLPGEEGADWGLYAENQLAANTTVALVEWQDADPSGRWVEGETSTDGITTVRVETSQGLWSAAVDANGEVVWSDPLPEDPSELFGAIGDAGIATEGLADSCTTCTGGIAWFVVAIVVVVVVVAAVAIYTAYRDPPNKGNAAPAPAPVPQERQRSGSQQQQRQSNTPAAQPANDCGPAPTGDIRKDAAARRRHFAYLQCMARAGASASR